MAIKPMESFNNSDDAEENSEEKEQFKKLLKESLKELFLYGEIEIKATHESDWEKELLVIEVIIDNEVVYKNKDTIGDSGWRDC